MRRHGTIRGTGAIVMATALAASGCSAVGEALGTSTDRYQAACALVVDGSGSGEAPPEGFDARAKMLAALPDFLGGTECRTLTFAPITAASEGSVCQADPLDLDPDADARTGRDEVRAAQRAVAHGQAVDLLECAREHEPGSDVLGALDRISAAAPADGAPLHILVVSDFVQQDVELQLPDEDLSTAEARTALIDRIDGAGRLPAVTGAVVHPVGFGMRYSEQPAAYADFEAFWTELLEGRVEADVDSTYRR
jgi:hypothetical protein